MKFKQYSNPQIDQRMIVNKESTLNASAEDLAAFAAVLYFHWYQITSNQEYVDNAVLLNQKQGP